MPPRSATSDVCLVVDDPDRWTHVVVDLPTMLASIEAMLDGAAEAERAQLVHYRDQLCDARSRFWWRRRSATWRLAGELADLFDRSPALKAAFGRANRRLVARGLPPELGAALLAGDDEPNPPGSRP